MSIYRYADGSVVAEAVFHHAGDRPPVALLSAADGAAPERLSALRRAVRVAGWQDVPIYAEGKPALQVSGFKQDSELDDFLHAHRFAQGPAVITVQTGDNPEVTARERIERSSLKLSGWMNILGNTQLMADGFRRHAGRQRDYYRSAGAGLLLLGAANLARYGNAKAEHYTKEAAQDLAEYIRTEGGPLPAEDAPPERRVGRAERFLYRYPAQVTLGVDSIGAASNLLSGIRRTRAHGEWGGLGFGASSLGLKLAALAIPEKSADAPKEGASGAVGKAVAWVQEKPLRLYGYGSLVNDAFLGIQAYQQYRPGKKHHVLTAGAATCFTLADLLIAISSKDHVNADGKFTADEQTGIEALAAAAVAAKPETERAQTARKLGDFLAKRREMRGDAQSVSRSIIEQARHRRENPWVSRIGRGGENTGKTLGA